MGSSKKYHYLLGFRLLYVFWFIALFTVFSCSHFVSLKVARVYFCDQFREGKCLLRQPETSRVYRPVIPKTRSSTWFDLGYYMYFHTRETPGIRVEFNRSLSSREKEVLAQSLRCELVLRSRSVTLRSEMEGRRIDRNGFWCFDYLGSNLVSLLKKEGLERKSPNRSYFPIELEIHWKSGLAGVSGSQASSLRVDWRKN